MPPTTRPGAGAKPLRVLLALAGCTAILGGAWLIWGDAFSKAVANRGQRALALRPADPAPPKEPADSGVAPTQPAQPPATAPAQAEAAAAPKASTQKRAAAPTKGETPLPAALSAAADKATAAASPRVTAATEASSPPGLPAVDRGAAPSPPAAAPRQREFVVYFTLTSTEIPIYGQETLAAVARRLAESPRAAALIEGHSDAMGDPAFNQAISISRAAAVRDFLVEKGVSASRLSVVGMGSATPQETNDTSVGRSRNRRVVVRLMENP